MQIQLQDSDLTMWKKSLSVSKRIAVFLSLLLLLFACAACTKNPAPVAQNGVITFTDALQREVCISKNPQRVAALIGSFADVWMLSGGTVCATAEDAWDDFGLDLDGAVNIGGAHSPSLEVLLSCNPDLVIASASTASNVEMKDTLEGAGVTVIYFDVDCFDDYLSMLDICTDITGRKDLFKQNGTDIKLAIDEIKNNINAAELTEKERTVLLLRTSSGSVKAKGSSGTVLGEMLCDLGCINIADNNSSLLENLSVESVIRQSPYRIFAVTMGDNTQKAVENLNLMIQSNPAWSTLEAIKEGRLHIMDRKLFNIKPNAKWAESYEKLGGILLDTKK